MSHALDFTSARSSQPSFSTLPGANLCTMTWLQGFLSIAFLPLLFIRKFEGVSSDHGMKSMRPHYSKVFQGSVFMVWLGEVKSNLVYFLLKPFLLFFLNQVMLTPLYNNLNQKDIPLVPR